MRATRVLIYATQVSLILKTLNHLNLKAKLVLPCMQLELRDNGLAVGAKQPIHLVQFVGMDASIKQGNNTWVGLASP